MLISDGGAQSGGSEAGVDSQRAGSFRFLFADRSWEWSPEVERMHGYAPGDAAPTMEVVLSHKHPDDHSHVAATLEEIRRTGRPFSARHRIVDVGGRVREVVVVGDRLLDDAGRVVGTQGYYIDVTPPADRDRRSGHLEQARGMLMLVYRIDAEAAIDLLRWRSQAGGVDLRALGEQIVEDFLGLPYSDVLPPRSSYDQLLLTAHQRVDRDGPEPEPRP